MLCVAADAFIVIRQFQVFPQIMLLVAPPAITEAWVQHQASPCGVSGGHGGIGTGFSPNPSVLPSQ